MTAPTYHVGTLAHGDIPGRGRELIWYVDGGTWMTASAAGDGETEYPPSDVTNIEVVYEPPPLVPRIPEPGTWGVVKASCVHDDTRSEWVHYPDGNWHPALPYSVLRQALSPALPDDWDSLVDPNLIRPGVDDFLPKRA